MSAEATIQNTDTTLWKGGKSPFKFGYGKVMMWYFLISDTFTFGAFLLAYGTTRVMHYDAWPIPSEVFKSVPIKIGSWDLASANLPLVFVSIMTFILILSSVTMVRAVQEGFQKNRKGVIMWLVPTILGGLAFLGCQYLEWSHMIEIHHGLGGMTLTEGLTYEIDGVIKTAHPSFGSFFFLITGFHGLHVTLGVGLNIWLLYKAANGHFDRIGHYNMVEKIGLYWHFVDLVWVFVFLCYYLL